MAHLSQAATAKDNIRTSPSYVKSRSYRLKRAIGSSILERMIALYLIALIAVIDACGKSGNARAFHRRAGPSGSHSATDTANVYKGGIKGMTALKV